jgi:hypothetical protein
MGMNMNTMGNMGQLGTMGNMNMYDPNKQFKNNNNLMNTQLYNQKGGFTGGNLNSINI